MTDDFPFFNLGKFGQFTSDTISTICTQLHSLIRNLTQSKQLRVTVDSFIDRLHRNRNNLRTCSYVCQEYEFPLGDCFIRFRSDCNKVLARLMRYIASLTSVICSMKRTLVGMIALLLLALIELIQLILRYSTQDSKDIRKYRTTISAIQNEVHRLMDHCKNRTMPICEIQRALVGIIQQLSRIKKDSEKDVLVVGGLLTLASAFLFGPSFSMMLSVGATVALFMRRVKFVEVVRLGDRILTTCLEFISLVEQRICEEDENGYSDSYEDFNDDYEEEEERENGYSDNYEDDFNDDHEEENADDNDSYLNSLFECLRYFSRSGNDSGNYNGYNADEDKYENHSDDNWYEDTHDNRSDDWYEDTHDNRSDDWYEDTHDNRSDDWHEDNDDHEYEDKYDNYSDHNSWNEVDSDNNDSDDNYLHNIRKSNYNNYADSLYGSADYHAENFEKRYYGKSAAGRQSKHRY